MVEVVFLVNFKSMCFIGSSQFYMKNRYFSKSTNSKRIVSHCAQKSDYPLSNKLGFSIRSHCLIKHHSQQGALVTNSIVHNWFKVFMKSYLNLSTNIFQQYPTKNIYVVSKLYRQTLFRRKFLLQFHKDLKPIYDVNLIKIRAIFSISFQLRAGHEIYKWCLQLIQQFKYLGGNQLGPMEFCRVIEFTCYTRTLPLCRRCEATSHLW